jgi:peptide/nickel transport system ATP-binding protein
MAVDSTPAALDVRHLGISYLSETGPAPAVEDVSFAAFPGETFGLAGESGCGKSTIAHAILRILRAPGLITSGEIRVGGEDVLTLPNAAVRALRWRRASIVLQNSLTALDPVRRIGTQLADVLARGSRYRISGDLLEMVGIDRTRTNAYPHELSGGMRQRVVIAMALALEPDLLILDEPTTALDVIVQKDIFRQIKALQHELGFAALLISHDLPLLFEVADRLAIMKEGRIVETGTVAAFRLGPKHAYSRTLLSATPRLDHVSPIERATPVEPLLRIENLSKRYASGWGRRGQIALSGVSLTAFPGEIVAVVGQSGSGKSTLGRIVTGHIAPTEGLVTIAGRPPVPVSQRRRSDPRPAQMVFQDVYGSLNPVHTVRHHLRRAVLSTPGGFSGDLDARVDSLLTEVGLTPLESYRGRRPHELSGGQRQRVGIARALASDPKLLVADEPVSMLDVSIRIDVLKLIARLREEFGLAVLYITHDIVSAGFLADRVIVMHRGMIVEQGRAAAVLKDPRHPYTRQLLAAVPANPIAA